MATCIFTPRITFSPTPHEFTSNTLSVGWDDGGKDLFPWRWEKTTTFNFPREIIYSCLYWALLKGEKKDGEKIARRSEQYVVMVQTDERSQDSKWKGPFIWSQHQLASSPLSCSGLMWFTPPRLVLCRQFSGLLVVFCNRLFISGKGLCFWVQHGLSHNYLSFRVE